jgi:hypothetical protein
VISQVSGLDSHCRSAARPTASRSKWRATADEDGTILSPFPYDEAVLPYVPIRKSARACNFSLNPSEIVRSCFDIGRLYPTRKVTEWAKGRTVPSR